MQNKNQILVMAQTPGQLAAKYGISTRTLKRRLDKFADKIGKRYSLYFTPLQVRTIYESLGIPKNNDKA